jgi:signal transduction histidine kinase/DNA-binding response OmpR family regulator
MKPPDRVNLLIVDDVPEKVTALAAVLEELGQNIVTAYSGRDALRCLLKDDFAAILLDVNMPDMDGFEAASLIRQRKRSEHTPIIFVTAFNDDAHIAQGYALGAVDYITTPVVPEVLRAKVGVFVELYQKTEMIRRQADHRVQLAREQAARHVAEDALRRSSMLVNASKFLARSLDYNATLANVSAAVVPALADDCEVIVREPGGGLARACPSEDEKFTGRRPIEPLDLDADSPIVRAVNESIDSGHARILRGYDVQEVSANTPLGRRKDRETHNGEPSDQEKADKSKAESTKADSAKSESDKSEKDRPPTALVLPLVARNLTHGALVLRFDNPRRRFGPADIAMAQEIAGRAATALDNARMYQTICEGERRKDEFLAMLGHELRNPLAAITNAAELMNMLEPSDPSFDEARDIVRKQASLMKRLVDDLLDVSRIASGRIQLQKTKVEVREVVHRVVEAMGPLFESRRHTLDVSLPSAPLYISADPFRLEQILSNLLVNAAKYTDPGGKVWLMAAADEGTVVVQVKDTGIGIAPEVLPRVFELFAQADQSLHRSQGGLGIGLTIVQGLVTLHGGQALVHSEGLGRGAEFIVRLPIALEAGTTPPVSSSESLAVANGGPRRILVVEDQFAVAKVTVALLRKLGHQVWAASDGPAAISAVQEHKPEVVFMDIGLPGMDGYEVARKLRGEMGPEAPLLVAVTGYGQQEDRRRAVEAGFDRHLVKPVGLNALQDVLFDARTCRAETVSLF